jgi:hypothetical protein
LGGESVGAFAGGDVDIIKPVDLLARRQSGSIKLLGDAS